MTTQWVGSGRDGERRRPPTFRELAGLATRAAGTAVGALERITYGATLAQLPAHRVMFPADRPGRELGQAFDRFPDLPGVIVPSTDSSPPRAVSRERYFQCMSRPFRRELYLARGIENLLREIPVTTLRLPLDTPVEAAARLALERPQESTYEPLLAIGDDGEARLIDVHALLLAQTKLLTIAYEEAHRQKEAVEAANRSLKEAQAALVQSEKLAGLGQLAAGVAHEINNPLAYAMNNVSVLARDQRDVFALLDRHLAGLETLRGADAALADELEELADGLDIDYIRDHYDSVIESTLGGLHRVRDIVRNLCDFASLNEASWKDVDLNAAMKSAVEVLGSQWRSLDLALDFEPGDIPAIPGHPGKLNQLFLNLVQNAIQASERGGRIRLSSRFREGEVICEVADRGCGIPADVLPRLFEPFFTTRPVGAGMGLGLSVGYRTVQGLGGRIEVESEPGVGSLFRVILPAPPVAAARAGEVSSVMVGVGSPSDLGA
jgi:signal transduction histidine kinase